MDTVNISLTKDQVKTVDQMVDEYGFANRSEFFRSFLRLLFRRPEAIIEADELVLEAPDTRKVSEVVKSFKETGLYKKEFLKDLEKGLKSSSYFK